MIKPFVIGVLLLMSAPAFAVGPSAVAAPDRTLWPDSVDSTAAFDRASRAEMLVFGHELAESEKLSDDDLMALLKIKQVDHASVETIRSKYWKRLATGYALASARCAGDEPFCPKASDETSFRKAAMAFASAPSARYDAWFANAREFHRVYLNELLRLGALFPHISSEVDTFSAKELSGNEPADRTFLLTFDDGPTRADGTTDKTQAMLRNAHLNATFFVLGGNLEARLKQTPAAQLAQNYAGMCVGAHGWEHKSHSSWVDWQSSVTRTTALVHDTMPASYQPLFRPPYGQRRADSGEFFDAQGIRVMLWNIDSQDWNNKVNADQVKQRVLTLMLLWRHGVILFHDIHPKALVAVPWILDQTRGSGVTFMDCHSPL
ncbi:peptidoglycan/xylan/chitin deacetylase (PgdA/CDA1 family) [Luteibacter sp. Sphag1AF]|uniref:polysaccharide deacetylase family protein n=1 Tax=Luteibacter sp. Sphag1AF TaxID=2587031 RepID=UPI0018171392|nr:polysaccharide deacetylase family protein [Luteibacter sp. Sphag1AF]MBB3226453.1 peptidoglycan/xylan/chitin deacetylase (PgdA/CDA1 family) [Luteibacter sp. Sphag1AF]